MVDEKNEKDMTAFLKCWQPKQVKNPNRKQLQFWKPKYINNPLSNPSALVNIEIVKGDTGL